MKRARGHAEYEERRVFCTERQGTSSPGKRPSSDFSNKSEIEEPITCPLCACYFKLLLLSLSLPLSVASSFEVSLFCKFRFFPRKSSVNLPSIVESILHSQYL